LKRIKDWAAQKKMKMGTVCPVKCGKTGRPELAI